MGTIKGFLGCNSIKQTSMERKEFIKLAGAGAGWMLISTCFTNCSNNAEPAPTNVDFTIDVSTGALAQTGGSIIQSGVIVARTLTGDFIAVASACTHQGTTIQYQAGNKRFQCPNHGATFNESGSVTNGPAKNALRQFTTMLSGTMLRVSS